MLCFCFCFFITLFTRSTSQPTAPASVYSCPNASTYTPTSAYRANLNSLLSNLSSAGPRESGFYNYVVDGPSGSNTTVYGLFMCLGYVSTYSCGTCVKEASTDILQLCPKQKTAIVWYEYCMLRYSDESIMGRAYQPNDEQVMYLLRNKWNHSQPALFMQLLGKTLNQMITRLTGDRAGKKFVIQQVDFTASDRIYILGQCTPNLSDLDCQKCLNITIQVLPSCCYSAVGARAILPSCMFCKV